MIKHWEIKYVFLGLRKSNLDLVSECGFRMEVDHENEFTQNHDRKTALACLVYVYDKSK